MATWIEPQPVSVPAALQQAVGGQPLVAGSLARRGLLEPEAALAYLDPARYRPADPGELPGLQAAASRLQGAIRAGETIGVWGDFDVDGQTATTLLVSTLRALGARVVYHIPVRESESHGVNLPGLKAMLDGGVELILTCDTGIAAHEAAGYARQRGVDLIISDHHDLPDQLPDAYAVVNPKLLPAGHPLGSLPGAGVAYKLVEELYRRFGREGEGERELDLAALGIVADVALLAADTRFLLQRGLESLRANRRLGLQEMLRLAEVNPSNLSEEHIGFVIAPRLNALGRLADANPAVEFLTTRELSRAKVLALELEGLNARRKLLTEQVFQGALAQLGADPALQQEPVLVLSHPAWPAGVIGIVASRLVERYRKPVVLLSAPPGRLARGSARSVEGLNITQAIRAQSHLLRGFGGHPMAAGLSIPSDQIPELRRGLVKTISEMASGLRGEPGLQIDGYVPLEALSLDLVADLERLSPFGAGNPALVLASRRLSLKSYTPVGREGDHLQLVVEAESGESRRVIWWQAASGAESISLPSGRFDLAYSVRASSFGGQREVQVEWVDFRPLEEPALALESRLPAIEIVDLRQKAQPLAALQRLRAQGDLQVWGEGEARQKLDARNRLELITCERLAIWTTPAGPLELRLALERARPQTVFLFSVEPRESEMGAFLARLAGLVKYALRAQGGQVALSSLAAATAQRLVAVRRGLDWLAAHRDIQVEFTGEDEALLRADRGRPSADLPAVQLQLKAILDETAAYRSYFARAEAPSLFPVQLS